MSWFWDDPNPFLWHQHDHDKPFDMNSDEAMLIQSAASTTDGHIGGKPVDQWSVSSFSDEQITYIHEQITLRGSVLGYAEYNDGNMVNFLWHGSYMNIQIVTTDGEIYGATTRLREGWEDQFAMYVDTTLDKVEKSV